MPSIRSRPLTLVLSAALAAFAALVRPDAARAQEDAASLDSMIERYLTAEQDAERGEVLAWLRESRFDFAAIVAALKARHPTEAWTTGVHEVELAGSKRTKLFVPKDYTSDRKWPLLITLHGSGGDARQVFDPILPLLEQEEFLCISPTSRGFGWLASESSLTLASLRWAQEHLHVDTNRVYLFGASMGGFGTFNNGLRNPDYFAALFPYAGGLQWMTAQLGTLDRKGKMLVANAGNLGLYILHGGRDVVVRTQASRAIAAQLEEFGYDFRYNEQPEWEHIPPEEGLRQVLLDDAWPWLKKRVRNPWPQTIRFVTFDSWHRHAYWITIPGGGTPDGAAVFARAEEGNVLRIDGHGAARVELRLGPPLVDLSKPVRVIAGGREVFNGRVAPDLAVVLEQYRARRDPAMLPLARLEVPLVPPAGE